MPGVKRFSYRLGEDLSFVRPETGGRGQPSSEPEESIFERAKRRSRK